MVGSFDNVVQKFCSCPWYREAIDAIGDTKMHWQYRGTCWWVC